MAKRVLELDDAAVAAGGERILDIGFLAEHCSGFDAFAADLRAESWPDLAAASGVPYQDIDALARVYAKGKAVIATWGMGLTQHRDSVAAIQMLSNLMMMRGNIGRLGAGLCPVRGHSNVQGDRTMASRTSPPRPSSTGCAMSTASNRRAGTAWTRWTPSRRCWTGGSRSSSAWAAISRWRRRTRRAPSKRCATAI